MRVAGVAGVVTYAQAVGLVQAFAQAPASAYVLELTCVLAVASAQPLAVLYDKQDQL